MRNNFLKIKLVTRKKIIYLGEYLGIQYIQFNAEPIQIEEIKVFVILIICDFINQPSN